MNMKSLEELAYKYPDDIQPPFGSLFERIGFEGIRAVSEELGGSNIYVPATKRIFNGCIARQILLDYNGVNIRELCKKFSLCETTVRSIIDRGY